MQCGRITDTPMNKVVLKSALITVASLVAVGILTFSLWILISPQSMAAVSEKLGNYGFAVTCADLQYKYSGESYDLARCAEDSVLTGNDKIIVKYCGELIGKDDFDEVCRRRDEERARTDFGSFAIDYNTYILSNLVVAQYREGDLRLAVTTAERGKKVECFRKLVIEVVKYGTPEDLGNLQAYPTRIDAQEYVKGLIESLLQKS